jgi:hypothetical protein
MTHHVNIAPCRSNFGVLAAARLMGLPGVF